MKKINISDFETDCRAILDEISRTGGGVTILRQGRPIAQLLPPTLSAGAFPPDDLEGTVDCHGDIVGPVATAMDRESRGA